MAGNNTNIVHVTAIQGLLTEVVKHLKALEPDEEPNEEGLNKFSAQAIAKEDAENWVNQFQLKDVHKLQQVFE